MKRNNKLSCGMTQDTAGGTVLSACAKINIVTVFGKKYTNDNLLSVRKLKDSWQFVHLTFHIYL